MISKIERFLSSMKFAVILLGLLSLLMVIGTVIESLGGARVASVLIYRSPFFLILEGLLFLSVFFTILKRLPPRKIFIGFYMLHLGILSILLGSFVTYYSGVDGSLRLMPKMTNNQVELSRRFFYVQDSKGNLSRYLLPEGYFPSSLDKKIWGIELRKYYPFAQLKVDLVIGKANSLDVINDQGERLLLTLSTLDPQFGPLGKISSQQYLMVGEKFESCLNNMGGIVLLDYKNETCSQIKKIQKSKLGNSFFEYGDYKFYPSMTPYPMNREHSFEPGLWLYAVDTKLIRDKRIVVLGPRSSQRDDVNYYSGKVPSLVPRIAFPYKSENRKEGLPGYMTFNFEGKNYILSAGNSMQLTNKRGESLQVFMAPEFFELGFNISLDRFKMDMNPGTQMPASFESFVIVKDRELSSKHHIFMNHPLKYKQFTFYQSSYFESDGGYGSILSVNYDPGRILKYIGSLLLVLGSLLHYYLISKRETK